MPKRITPEMISAGVTVLQYKMPGIGNELADYLVQDIVASVLSGTPLINGMSLSDAKSHGKERN